MIWVSIARILALTGVVLTSDQLILRPAAWSLLRLAGEAQRLPRCDGENEVLITVRVEAMPPAALRAAMFTCVAYY